MSVDFLPKNFPPFQVHHAKKPPRFYPDGFQRNVIDFYFIFSDCRLRKALYLQFSYFIWPLIASAPEFSAPIFVLQFSKFLVQHRAALSLQVSHKSRHRHLRWNLYQNMNMVRAHLPFQETNSFPFTQLPQDFSYFCSFFLIEYFSPVLGCKHYMVLAVPFCVR